MTIATRKVALAMAAQADPFMTANMFVERNDDEPIAEEECPAMSIRLLGDQISPGIDLSGTEHRATYQVVFTARPLPNEKADEACERMAGEFIASLEANRALGGRVQYIEEQSFVPNSRNVQNVSEAEIEVLVVFFTPRGDLTTIVGHGGTLF